MSNWEKVKVKDVCTIVNGGTPKTSVEEYWNSEDVVWITPTDITQLNSKYISDSSRKISTKGLSESSATLLPVGSVLMCSRATIGPCAINTIPVSTNQGFKSFICSERINNEYLYYLISILKDYFIDNASGSTFLEVSKSVVENCELMLPPLKEQQKIAEILSSVDAAIEKTEQVIAKTEEVKKGLMQQLLTKGIGHTEFKQTEIGEIPVGWNVINLEEICSLITYGFTNPMPTTDEGPYMITAKDIRDGAIQYKTARKTSMECYSNDLTDKSRPSIGDILITKDGTLGRLAIVKQEGICINQSVARIVLKDINLVKYIYYLLDSPQVQTRILAESGGSTIKHIYITKLAKTLIPISNDVEEIKNITNILDSYDYKISSEKRKYNYLINIKKGLMQQLLTGQVRVKID